MTTQMITMKIDPKLLKQIDEIAKQEGYKNRTELIRKTLRDEVEKQRVKNVLYALSKLKGSVKKHITEEEYEYARSKAYLLQK